MNEGKEGKEEAHKLTERKEERKKLEMNEGKEVQEGEQKLTERKKGIAGKKNYSMWTKGKKRKKKINLSQLLEYSFLGAKTIWKSTAD